MKRSPSAISPHPRFQPSQNPQTRPRRLAHFLTYPKNDPNLLEQRLAWLQAQGITGIYNYGSQPKAGLQLLGIGYCGVVLLAARQGQPVALKLRRWDAPQASLQREAEALSAANRVAVGPRLMGHSADILIMDYCPGPGLMQWLETEQPGLDRVWPVLHSLLDQAFRLDQSGWDHGDLRCVTEHVRVWGDRPRIIDFSRASQDRRPANVTTLVQGIWIGTAIAATLQRQYPSTSLAQGAAPHRQPLIQHLRQYKLAPSDNTYQVLLNFLKP